MGHDCFGNKLIVGYPQIYSPKYMYVGYTGTPRSLNHATDV